MARGRRRAVHVPKEVFQPEPAASLGDDLTNEFAALVQALPPPEPEPEPEQEAKSEPEPEPALAHLIAAAVRSETLAGRHRQSAAIGALAPVLEEVRIALASAIPASTGALHDALNRLASLI